MTLGEKIKSIRREFGLSQEELAQKLCVSRQAITKWESNNGKPDIINLKTIAQLFDISIDCFVDEESILEYKALKEPINIHDYPQVKGNKLREDFVVLDKYANATKIVQLSWKKKMSKKEIIFDYIFGMTYFTISHWQNPSPYYLVEQFDDQYLVQVTADSIISKKLIPKMTSNNYELDDMVFSKTLHKLK